MIRHRFSIPALLVLVAASAGAQNLLVNPDFDQDAGGWQLACGKAMTWFPEDEAGCPGSGSVTVLGAACMGQGGALTGQCLPVGTETHLWASGRARAVDGFLAIGFQFHDQPDCAGDPIETVVSPPSDVTGNWESPFFDAPIPAGTESVGVGFGALGLTPVDAGVDSAYAGFAELVFRDGFEGDTEGDATPCRWSSVVG